MQITGKVHCFFEQSGTFKNEFRKLGFPSEDYDIQNNFGETDHVVDLFGEIDKAYDNLTEQNRTEQNRTEQNIIRFYQSKSRPYYCFFPLYLFYWFGQSLLLYSRKHKLSEPYYNRKI